MKEVRRLERYPSTRLRMARAVGGVVLVALIILGVYAAVRYTDWFRRIGSGVQTVSQGQLPAWMMRKQPATALNGATPAVAPAPEPRVVAKAPAPRPAPVVKAKPPPPTIKRPAVYFVTTKHELPKAIPAEHFQTAPWTYLPCVLENVVVSEIPGMFTVKLTRPVWDARGQVVLLPQGQRIGAKAATAALLLGNERIPTFALSIAMPDGEPLELGEAPIMDASGTNGLTGEVDNHTWRIIWTSLAIEGLRAGQQLVNQQIASQGDGVTVTGVGQYSTSIAQQRLGRAQDTRPTITAASGEVCQILVPKALSLPRVASAR